MFLSGSIPVYWPRYNSSGRGFLCGTSVSECTAPKTTRWSPPSCTECTVQSMCASVPLITGDPDFDGPQSMPANLSGSLEPNRAETSVCFSCRTFTQNLPEASMAFHDLET